MITHKKVPWQKIVIDIAVQYRFLCVFSRFLVKNHYHWIVSNVTNNQDNNEFSEPEAEKSWLKSIVFLMNEKNRGLTE